MNIVTVSPENYCDISLYRYFLPPPLCPNLPLRLHWVFEFDTLETTYSNSIHLVQLLQPLCHPLQLHQSKTLPIPVLNNNMPKEKWSGSTSPGSPSSWCWGRPCCEWRGRCPHTSYQKRCQCQPGVPARQTHKTHTKIKIKKDIWEGWCSEWWPTKSLLHNHSLI